MTNPIIKPTVGRRVWFRPSAEFLASNPTLTQFNPEQPMDAGIVYVHHDHMVNLIVTDHVGKTIQVPSVPLLAGQYEPAEDGDVYCCCEWMPYQKGQAAKTEAAEKVAAPIDLPVIDPGLDSLERDIQAKASAGPRVTPADIEAEIASEFYFTAADGVRGESEMGTSPAGRAKSLELLTFCVLVLRNVFTVTGESACASPENFNAEIGRRIARENAINKVWPLLGFRLRDKLAEGRHTSAA